MTKKPQQRKKSNWLSLHQLETIIFRTMRIERPEMTRDMAHKAAAKLYKK